MKLWGRDVSLRLGPLERIEAPDVGEPGPRVVAVTAISPVAIGLAPTAATVRAALLRGFPRRLGLHGFDDRQIVVSGVLPGETWPCAVTLGLHGDTRPIECWMGRTLVECNAVAHWMLECAARGPGLGGRVAFGFGAVSVRRVA